VKSARIIEAEPVAMARIEKRIVIERYCFWKDEVLLRSREVLCYLVEKYCKVVKK
jgi:hypothetical protein